MTTANTLTVETPSDREVRVTRHFKAPARLVWEAHHQPELLRKWMYGYEGWDLSVCDMDVRPGGAYRWRWRNTQDGTEFGFFGTFLELTPYTRYIHEQHFDAGTLGVEMTNAPVVITTDLVESGGETTISVTMQYVSREERDSALATGMTDGMETSYQRIDALLAG